MIKKKKKLEHFHLTLIVIKCLKLGSLENLKFEFARAPILTATEIWIVKNLHVILKRESGYLHFISYLYESTSHIHQED